MSELPAMQRTVVLKSTPRGALERAHFDIKEQAVVAPGDNECVVRTCIISIDAANRAWMQGATYRSAVEGGQVMSGYGLGVVVASNAPERHPGDIVLGDLGWQEYATLDAHQLVTPTAGDFPVSYQLSALGISGKTAWHGLHTVGGLKPDDVVLVSAVAGAAGNIVAQLAKRHGCRVVGVAGGEKKCQWAVKTLGIDACIDYKSKTMMKDIFAACPKGVDLYFDNVGGPVLEAALFAMNEFGRVICCGAVSQYDSSAPSGPRGVPGLLVVKRLMMKGFIVMDHQDKDPECEDDLRAALADGQLQVHESPLSGLDALPEALIGLLAGDNIGKRIVHVAHVGAGK